MKRKALHIHFTDEETEQLSNVDHNLQKKMMDFANKYANPNTDLTTVVKHSRGLGIILSAVQTDHQNIFITGDKFSCHIEASDDSCGCNDSHASLSCVKGSLKQMIGNEVISAISVDKELIEAYYSKYEDSYTSNYDLYIFELSRGTSVHILGEHHHNGYYGGGSFMKRERSEGTPIVKNENCRIIIVVGLPASGKTTYCQNNFKELAYYIMDDTLSFDCDHQLTLTALLEQGLRSSIL